MAGDGCGRRLAAGQYWTFCGETDMGQTMPALCTECGGECELAPPPPPAKPVRLKRTVIGDIPEPENVDPVIPQNPDRENLRLKAAEWTEQNPEAYDLFKRFAADVVRVGFRCSISFITERVRWETEMVWEKDRRGFKLNNNYRAYIARKLVVDVPGLEPLIRFRKTRY